MKYLIKKTYLALLFSIILFPSVLSGKEVKTKYTRGSTANYFSGVVSINQFNNTDKAYKYLYKIQFLKNAHTNYNVKFIYTLILLEKYKEALNFSKSIWSKEEFFLEVDLLIGLDFFIKKDYLSAEKHFKRLNKNTKNFLIFGDFLENVLLSWTKAAQNDQEQSFKYLSKIPDRYYNLKEIQNSFLQCYFDTEKALNNFTKLTEDDEKSFSRYNFFLANYLFHKKENAKATKLIHEAKKKYYSNLLINQTHNYVKTKSTEKIKNFFNCKNPRDSLAEFFYVIANLYSGEKDYQLSNFYLKISLFLNNKFLTNKALLAENFLNFF